MTSTIEEFLKSKGIDESLFLISVSTCTAAVPNF